MFIENNLGVWSSGTATHNDFSFGKVLPSLVGKFHHEGSLVYGEGPGRARAPALRFPDLPNSLLPLMGENRFKIIVS